MDADVRTPLVIGNLLLFILLAGAILLGKNSRTNWVPAFVVALNRDWGIPDREKIRRLKLQARKDVMKSMGGVSNHLVSGLKEALEIHEAGTQKAIPSMPTAWLVVLVIFEALQFVAIPMAPGIPWARNSCWGRMIEVLASCVPRHDHPQVFQGLIWILLLPSLISILLVCGFVILFLAWGLSEICKEHIPDASLKVVSAAIPLVRWTVWLATAAKELVLESALLYMFIGLLMALSGSMHNSQLMKAACWKSTAYRMHAPLAFLQIAALVSLLFWNNHPLYTMSWILQYLPATSGRAWNKVLQQVCLRILLLLCRALVMESSSTCVLMLGDNVVSVPQDDNMLLVSEFNILHVKDDSGTDEIQIYDFDRPVNSSAWSCFSGSLKLSLAFLYVFTGQDSSWTWPMLCLTAVVYLSLFIYNIQELPCSFNWVNTSRTMGLLAGLGSTGCGCLATVLGPSSDLPTIILLVVLCLLMFFTPIALYWASCAQATIMEAGSLLKIDIFQSYAKLLALCRLSMLVRTHVVGNADAPTPSNQAALASFATLRDATIETMRQRLAVRLKEWNVFSAKGKVFPDACLPCFSKILFMGKVKSPRKKLEEKSSELCVMKSRSAHSSRSRVEEWLDSATLIIDPKEDIELGLNLPFDIYMPVTDDPTEHTDGAPLGLDQVCRTPEPDQIPPEAINDTNDTARSMRHHGLMQRNAEDVLTNTMSGNHFMGDL